MQQNPNGGGGGAHVMRRSMEQLQQEADAEEPSGLMQTYLQRYEALQQERLRSRRQRASDPFFSPSASAADSDAGLRQSGTLEHAAGFFSNRYDHSAQQHAADDAAGAYSQESVQAPQQEQQWSYAEYEHEREDDYKHHDEEDTSDFAPVADSLTREQQHQARQYNPFQDTLAEQQASYLTGAQTYGVSVASDEFVDAATYLEKNQLGGDDSFEEDVDHQAQWERQDESVLESEGGRPSDFFEKRSRNMERVEFALDNETEHRCSFAEEFHHSDEQADYSGHNSNRESIRARSGPLDTSLSLSDSNTAFSSGYDVHFDNARQAFTPNSLKHLQEKSRRRTPPLDVHEEEPQPKVAAQHENEARSGTDRPADHRLVVPAIDESQDELPESIRAMQRGPGTIVEALNEIDALISNPTPRAPREENGGRGPRGTASVHDIVREYDLSLETGLPLSRTTDSWGDDPEEEFPLREENVDSPPRSRENPPSASVETFRHRRGEHPSELNAIRESLRFSSISSMDNTNQLYRINEECDTSISSARTGETLPSSRAHHQVEASGDGERAEFASRLSTERGNNNSLTRKSGSMQPSDLTSNRDEGNATPRKMNGDAYFSDSIGKTDNNARPDFEARRSAGAVSPTKPRREEQWSTKGHSPRDPVSAPQKEVKQTKPQDKLRAGSSRQLFNNDVKVAGSLRNRDGGSQRILPHKSAKEENNEGLAINPIQLSRRCRRLLCTVGETMTERIVFSNGSGSMGRICVSLLPLSTGCQQFSVSPAVLELAPRASSSFHVTFQARTAGVAAGIFQFRGVGVESLFSPYEMLIEASVRRNLELDEYDVSGKVAHVGNNQKDRQVEELRRSKCINEVEIGPTFIKFDRFKTKGGVKLISSSTLKITNHTEQTQPFKINCSHENLKITPDNGFIPPASEAIVILLPLSRPLDQHRNGESLMSARSVSTPENWIGSFTVAVGKKVSREVSFVFNREVMEVLPPFDAIARSRHQISSQTDSFYYTKKRNRKGLYFHARAVECGSCNVGESHQVPVYICNGSSSPMTVFLQDLMDPFSCFYTTTTIEARKFIEIPVTFTPKVAGKVSTSLFAYSVTDKAVVTLVARGI